MRIKKKVQQKYFGAVVEGKKRFEIRLADFRCKPGDILILQEQKQGTKKLTGREIKCEILSKFNTKEMEKFHTKKEMEKYGFVILSIRKRFKF